MPQQLTLNDGHQLPALGCGLYKVDPAATEQVVTDAIAAGYRLIDGAAFYANEVEFGRAVRASGQRDRLLITSKFWGDPIMTRDQLLLDFERSFDELGVGPLDVYLIHWPRPSRGTYVDIWRGLIELREAGRVRSIAVSNFGIEELRRLIDETGVVPALNQVESHPWLPQHELRAFHREHGIVTQAWSPLGRGQILAEPVLQDIAAAHGATPAQVVLRWHLDLGGSAVPKSTHRARLRENLAAESLQLTDDDHRRIAAMESGRRTGSSPASRQ